MMLGKKIRLERILDRRTRRTVIVPMDHGVTLGPIKGLVNMREMVEEIAVQEQMVKINLSKCR